MDFATIIISIVIAAAFVAAVIYEIRSRKNSACGSCPYCSSCKKRNKKDKCDK